jgi:hypothetical protein
MIMRIFGQKAFLKIAVLAIAGFGASGCVYDTGLGYASDNYDGNGYYNNGNDCDPYGGYDSSYRCDYGSGFNNIGYGGGWYDNYWYPGYGIFLFDNVGRRYPMRDNHRRYWGEKRHNWYREHHGRNRDSGHYQRRGRDNRDYQTPGTVGRPERHGGYERRGGDNRPGRWYDRRDRNDRWRQDENRGAGAVRSPDPETVQQRGRERGEDYRRPDRRRDYNATSIPVPQQPRADRPVQDDGMVRRGRYGGGYRQPSPQPAPVADAQTATESRPAIVAPVNRPDRPERTQRQDNMRRGRMSEQ